MSVPNPAEKLLQRYADSSRIEEIARLSRKKGAPRIQVKGLAGSLESFLIAANYRHAGGHHLVVATDTVSYTLLRAHETGRKPACSHLLEK